MVGNKNSTFSHFPPTSSWSSETVNPLLFLHSNPNFLETLRLSFTLDVHETLLALILLVYFWGFGWIFFFFITVLFCALLSSPVICYLMRVRKWEREGMGITNRNGKLMGIKLGWTWDLEWEWDWTIGNGREWDWKRHSRSSLVYTARDE